MSSFKQSAVKCQIQTVLSAGVVTFDRSPRVPDPRACGGTRLGPHCRRDQWHIRATVPVSVEFTFDDEGGRINDGICSGAGQRRGKAPEGDEGDAVGAQSPRRAATAFLARSLSLSLA